ncbi:MAG: PilZ domain-containing protein [Desulfobulbales bacterium]
MATSDRRIIQRFPVDFRVDYIHAGNYMISCSQDVSMDGMFINTRSPAPVGSHVNLIFPSEGNHDVEVAALVVWIREQSSYQNPGMGVQFLSPLPQIVKKSFLKHIDRIVILSEKGISA